MFALVSLLRSSLETSPRPETTFFELLIELDVLIFWWWGHFQSAWSWFGYNWSFLIRFPKPAALTALQWSDNPRQFQLTISPSFQSWSRAAGGTESSVDSRSESSCPDRVWWRCTASRSSSYSDKQTQFGQVSDFTLKLCCCFSNVSQESICQSLLTGSCLVSCDVNLHPPSSHVLQCVRSCFRWCVLFSVRTRFPAAGSNICHWAARRNTRWSWWRSRPGWDLWRSTLEESTRNSTKAGAQTLHDTGERKSEPFSNHLLTIYLMSFLKSFSPL